MTNYIDDIYYDENNIINATVRDFAWKGVYYRAILKSEIRDSLKNYKENIEVII